MNVGTQTYNTFTELRKSIGTANAAVKVLGKDTPNDAFGGIFYYNSASTTPDDNTNVIQPVSTATGRWIRVNLSLNQRSILITFIVGDGAQYSPEDGDTEYNNPDLAGLSGGLIIRNGMPLLSGFVYLETGGFQLTGGDQFNTDEQFVWLVNASINNIPPDYSNYIKRQNVATFADVALAGDERLIVVTNDENNSNNQGFYYYRQGKLDWIISQPNNY